MQSTQSLLTVGEIARRLGQPIHRVEYLIRHRKIQATSWAGNAKVYGEADLNYIASELRQIAAERDGLGD